MWAGITHEPITTKSIRDIVVFIILNINFTLFYFISETEWPSHWRDIPRSSADEDDSPKEPIGQRKTDKGLVGAATILASVALGFDIRTTNLNIYRTGELEMKRQESIASSQDDGYSQTNGDYAEEGTDEDTPPQSSTSTVQLLRGSDHRRSSSPAYLRQTSWQSFDDNITMRQNLQEFVDGPDEHAAASQQGEAQTSSTFHKGHRRTASADNNLSNLTHKRTPSDGSSPSLPSSRWDGSSSAVDPWSSPDSEVPRLQNPPQVPPRKISVGKYYGQVFILILKSVISQSKEQAEQTNIPTRRGRDL